MHGTGEMSFPNGDKYTGDWNDGKRSGHGLYLHSNGNRQDYLVVFSGQIPVDGLFFVRFKGDYVDGVKQGFGQFWWTSGRHAGDKYVGQFRADKRHGYGQYSFANGNVYDGNWVNSMQQAGLFNGSFVGVISDRGGNFVNVNDIAFNGRFLYILHYTILRVYYNTILY